MSAEVSPGQLPEAVIVDVDGTLADVRSIRHYVVRTPDLNSSSKNVASKDFESFHREAEFVPVNLEVVEFCWRHHLQGRAIIVATGRMEQWRASTERFVRRALATPVSSSTPFPVPAESWRPDGPLPVAMQLHRADGDYRKDFVVKGEMLERIRQQYRVVAAIDDSPAIVALWREHGIATTVVPGWDES